MITWSKTLAKCAFALATLLAAAIGTGEKEATASAADFQFNKIGPGMAEITGYTGSETDLVIPKTVADNGETLVVTRIGNSAFDSWNSANKLTSVFIPDTVTSIGPWAFHDNLLESRQELVLHLVPACPQVSL